MLFEINKIKWMIFNVKKSILNKISKSWCIRENICDGINRNRRIAKRCFFKTGTSYNF